MSTLDLGKIRQLWRGAWSASNTYAANDIVTHNGAVWICTQPHATGLGGEFAPGRRDRLSAYGYTVQPDDVIVYNVTVQTVSSSNFFFIDGRQTPSITIYPNVRYRFLQRDGSNVGNRFAISTSIDGIFGAGTEITSYATYTGTAGSDGALDVLFPSTMPATMYYFSANNPSIGGGASGRLLRTASWRGWQYWDQLTSGIKFIGAWSSLTTYYVNDVVEYEGATYIAVADNLNKAPLTPATNQYWTLLVPGDRRGENNSGAWFMNKGPIDWPYGNGHNGFHNVYANLKWISRSGRSYNHGGGLNGSHGIHGGQGTVRISAPQENVFNHSDWWRSRDNGGLGRLTTPDGNPPRCIQIESGYNYTHWLFNNGEVWASGQNGTGALGVGDFSQREFACRVIGLDDVKIVKISVGYGEENGTRHVLALDDQGYVWSWGRNNVGQLGHGHTIDLARAERIPRSYFGGERVIDIIAMGNDSGHSYARVASDNLYAWGNNSIGQLGDNSTTTRYRPVRMTNWDPVANNGIRKWQAAHHGGSAAFMILDGNGFLWGTGEDSRGNLAQTTATNRTQLTRTTATPGGSIVDFWALWSNATDGDKITFIRHTNGTTFFCGRGSTGTYVTGNGTTQLSSQIGPSLIPTVSGLINIREVHLWGGGSTNRTVTFLREDGRIFSSGYNGYGYIGQPERAGTSSNTFDETGVTYYPLTSYLPPGTRVRQVMPGGSQTSGTAVVHGLFWLSDSGQLFSMGLNRNPSGTRDVNYANFITYSQNPGENQAVQMPVSLAYPR